MTRTQSLPLSAFVRARLSSEGYLGLHLTIGILILIVATLIFGNIAEDVMNADQITIVDVQVSQWFYAHRTTPWTQLMLVITHFHSTVGILVLGLLFAFHLIRKKAWDWLGVLVVVVPPGMLLNVALKHVFQRPRPSFDESLLTLTSYSFPSGHVAGATVFYGVFLAYLICIVRPWPWRAFLVCAAVALVALVGLSRIYLGVHYLSDVLAAVASSCAWLAFTFTAITTWRKRHITQRLAK